MAAEVPTVTMTRIIEASAAEVFNAWIDPALIHRWLAPPPNEVREVEVDARIGGAYRIVVVDTTTGDVHTTTGQYLELVPARRLVKTWKYDGPYGPDATPSLVTVELREIGAGVTELTLTHQQLRDAETARLVSGGWPLCLDRLAAVFQ